MSLLVTSCTMGHQPDRLLDKGPQYLRTRTNRGMFAHHRKSAVELLAASKSQFYKCPSVSLDDTCHVTQQVRSEEGVGLGQSESWKENPPPRSKSELDITTLQNLISLESNDENDNLTIPQKEDDGKQQRELSHHLDHVQQIKVTKYERENENQQQITSNPDISQNATTVCNNENNKEQYILKSTKENHNSKVKTITKDICSKTNKHTVFSNDKSNKQITNSAAKRANQKSPSTDIKVSNRPIPLPRKLKEKPIPPPRKFLPEKKIVSSNGEFDSSPSISVEETLIKQQFQQQQEQQKTNVSNVANLKKLFTFLSANEALPSSTLPIISNKPQIPTKKTVVVSSKTNNKNNSYQKISKNKQKDCTYQATPIFIAKPGFINENCSVKSEKELNIESENFSNISGQESFNRRKRYPEVSMSNESLSKREKKTSSTFTDPNLENKSDSISQAMSSSITTPGVIVEMSIESVDQAVCCDSEVNAIPAAITTSAESISGVQNDISSSNNREAMRKTAALNGKMDASLHEASLHTPLFNPSLPRSHSDISCRLEIESHHSRDSSIVSNRSRLSRASAGADLEQFFNQMGLEKGVLEPLNKLKEFQNSDILASVSSLDSHDATSICSSLSAHDNDNSESQAVENSQHPTSIIEKNARIIKWLCNVRKAKTQLLKSESSLSDLRTVPAGVEEKR